MVASAIWSSEMAILRASASLILARIILQPPLSLSLFSDCRFRVDSVGFGVAGRASQRGISAGNLRCDAAGSGGQKVSARLSQMKQLLKEAEERALDFDEGPTPKITIDHVTVGFARSGGPGGQNVNKLNTKVDMRFNLKNADWLGDKIREKIMQMEKNRINKDGELVISSTKTRTQKGNIDDALEKLQAIIDAAAYVPPPPSEEQKKKIEKMAAIGEHKRLKSKKVLSDKKAFRRSRDSWD